MNPPTIHYWDSHRVSVIWWPFGRSAVRKDIPSVPVLPDCYRIDRDIESNDWPPETDANLRRLKTVHYALSLIIRNYEARLRGTCTTKPLSDID
jgi:hypothetical protein